MASQARRAAARPCVGVTGSAERLSPSWLAIRSALFLVGARAVRITVRHPLAPEQLDALIVSGGHDIHPGLYGSQELPDKEYDLARDELEQRCIRLALDQRLPLMGICRGYQLINVVLGGTLFLDIRKLRRNTSNFGTVLPRKDVLLEESSLLHRLTGKRRLRVNSLHYQAVERVGANLRVTGVDRDHFVQALEPLDNRPVIGVQWHP
ncbi:MAG: gamma-glutamyl-gamma-aminobutyrate hydrolase family protein, partial [Halioglobus sp.]|nr:gamma-glutamyl-gamma-aminobutyrate hydrolase family protein [Halioglobus sp.]